MQCSYQTCFFALATFWFVLYTKLKSILSSIEWCIKIWRNILPNFFPWGDILPLHIKYRGTHPDRWPLTWILIGLDRQTYKIFWRNILLSEKGNIEWSCYSWNHRQRYTYEESVCARTYTLRQVHCGNHYQSSLNESSLELLIILKSISIEELVNYSYNCLKIGWTKKWRIFKINIIYR